MKSTKYFLAAAAILLWGSMSMRAADFKVIANTSVSGSSVSTDDLRDVFLENKDSVSGSHVEPVLQKGGAAHEAFLRQCVGKSDSLLQTYYRSLVFTGKGEMPKALGSDAEVVAYVAKTRGAIGYVSNATSAEGVKTLEVK